MKHSLQYLARGRQENNLNAIRLVLAILVILSHCFPIALGKEGDPLFVRSHHVSSFGSLAVDLFFFVSGFLITASWLNSRSMNDYLRRRILRIVPGYLVALVFSYIVAMAFSPDPFSDLETRLGKFRDVFWLGYSSSVGNWVFPINPFPFVSNGSLWTIKLEFACYLLIAAIGLFGCFKRRVFVLLSFFIVYCILTILKQIGVIHLDWTFLAFFLIGASVWLWRDRILVLNTIAIFALAIAVITIQFPRYFALLSPFIECYLVLWIGFAFRVKTMAWCDKTDLSYGVYLFAFPVQQALAALGMRSPWGMFIIATPVSLAIAFLSWNLVEKPCLRLKSKDFSDHDPCPGIDSVISKGPPASASSKL